MKIEKVSIESLVPYANNAKEHPQEQIDQIKASISEFGFNDPIGVDENNVIIEGHGRYKAIQQMGYEEVEIIRLDHLDPIQKKQYILAHNKLTMNSGFDEDVLKMELEAIKEQDYDIDITGFDIGELDDVIEGETTRGVDTNNEYTKKITAPTYEVRGEKPLYSEMYDLTKYNELVEKIDNSNLNEEQKEFLRLGATRHIVFNYENIAEYYAHAEAEEQDHIENSAMVIIDFEKAIENGYVKLKQEIAEQYLGDVNEG